MTAPLSWTASHLARRLIILTGLALCLAFALARPELVTIAAVPAWWVAVAPRRAEPAELRVAFEFPRRCFEDEPIPVSVRVECGASVDLIRVTLTPGPGLRGDTMPLTVIAAGAEGITLDTTVVAARWGRRELGHVTVECWTRRRLRHAVQVFTPRADLAVYPRPAALRRLAVTSLRYDRAGDHPAPAQGAGVEFHSIRRYTTADRPKRVNWPVSTRRGELYVTTTLAEQALDVVLALDVLTDTGPAGHSSRDLALRGATGVAQTALRAHDRVGLVAIGGRLQWLRADHTQRQFYRITEAILDVVDWESYLEPNVDAVPYGALPFGAQVMYFSALVDERGVDAASVLRARGHSVTVIDICTHEPRAQTSSERIARRLWRTERAATRNRLTSQGIAVTNWDGETALDVLLTPLPRLTARAPR
jgi:uncharacterized protein (DUF58 family)